MRKNAFIKLVCFSLVCVSSVLSAKTIESWGHVAVIGNDYFGLTKDGERVEFGEAKFSDAEVDVVAKCMVKKETHALNVKIKVDKIKVPVADMPGKETSVRTTKVASVECVRSAGMLYFCRKVFGAEAVSFWFDYLWSQGLLYFNNLIQQIVTVA